MLGNRFNTVTLKFISFLFVIVLPFFISFNTVFASQQTSVDDAAFREKIAIFPFDNYSDIEEALDIVMPALRQGLESEGYEVVDDEALYEFLCDNRVRETGYVSSGLSIKIRDRFKVNMILVGSIVSFADDGVPQLGLIARLIDSSTGTIVWADFASALGEDFSTVLGLGNIKIMEKLIPKVIRRLLDSFSTQSPNKEIESTYRIAVMPFQNDSENKDAGMIAGQLFLVKLFKHERFQPVEYGEVKKHIFDLRIRGRGGLDYNSIKELTGLLHVDGFLVGNVELYLEGESFSSPPKAAVSARLLDAHNKRILWYKRYQMSGDDDIIVFDWRRLRTVDKVADKIISKLVNNMENAEWR